MRKLTMVLVALLACATGLAAASAATTPAETTPEPPSTTATTATATGARATRSSEAAALRYLGRQIRQYQRQTWHWQRLMGVPRTDTYGRVLMQLSVPDAKKAVALWRGHAKKARRRARRPPHLRAFLCIHRYEATWRDRGAPYYGGLQMDWSFMRHYGGRLLRRKGTADRWTPLEQIWVAERAYRSGRGFYPWPNTARACGLL